MIQCRGALAGAGSDDSVLSFLSRITLVILIYAAGAVTISCGSSSRYDRSSTGGRLLSETLRALECWLAA